MSAVTKKRLILNYKSQKICSSMVFGEGESLTVSLSKVELTGPPMYKAVLINDDYTPMDFVVEVLRIFFNMSEHQATQVMLAVHTQGKGLCGVYTKDVAQTKVAQVNEYSKANEHPLLCNIEQDN